MSRQKFEELKLQLQQSGLPLKSYLQQTGVSYSTYHYWRKNVQLIGTVSNKSWLPSVLNRQLRNFP